MKRFFAILMAALMLASIVGVAAAEDWTWNQRVEIMIPAGEGGGLDTTLRTFGEYLSAELGTTVTIVNKSGNVGISGYTWSYNSTNDGYAFQFTAPTAIISDAQGLFTGFKLMDVLKPVSGLVMAEGMFFGRTDAPWGNDINELIKYAKEHPGEVTVAVDSPKGISGAVIAEFEKSAGVEFDWITSDSSEAYISVISKDIDICMNTWSDAGAYAVSGDLYALVTCAGQRNAAYPDVPCTAEIGVESTLGYYRVFTALEGTPDAAIDSFAAAVKRAVENPKWQEWLAQNGMTNDYVWDKEELAAVLKNTYDSTVALNAQ
ncbi:MAG: tripartite tricarboxylate transporter substrate binding protein [Clostridia bacterium]|nr:tripartite tricarboxylate transporter substrate binding protein [Clostridia bacterium]